MILWTIKEYIIMYLPVVLTIAGYVGTFLAIKKKLKNFSFRDEKDALEHKLDMVIQENRELRNDNIKLKKQLQLIIDKNMNIADYGVDKDEK